ncbi:MAG TPA: hypothetical protein VFQ77_15275 [Pseudonocardiaceae bacterium]|jgi:hypothetical protein|nr:hypothetical protein [Pseudonocardiaceae bacterium]
MPRPQDDVVPLHEPFETALRGFNRQQVLAHVESLDGQISMVTADRESALAQVAELSRTLDHLRAESELLVHLRREAEKAREQVELLHQSPITAASARIQRIVGLAEEEVAELRERARKEADELRARAEREVTDLKERTEQEIAARRKAAEQDTEREIARKEAEAKNRILRRDQRGLAGLYLMLKILNPHLAERAAAVERQEAELAESRARTSREARGLQALRAKITTQLSDTRQVLAQALEQVQQTRVDDLVPAHPVPVQRDGSPRAEHHGEGATVPLLSSRADERSA